MGDSLLALGDTTSNVHLNGDAFWRNVPSAVWTYKLAGFWSVAGWWCSRRV